MISKMYEVHRENYTVSTDPSRLDVPVIHHFLSTESYWAKNIPLPTVETCIQNSLCFGVYRDDAQVGFARAITDFGAIAYLADVFILPEERGKGLGKWLVDCILKHPALQDLRVWRLGTSDAHGLYEQYGFTPLLHPEMHMEKAVRSRYEPPA